MSGRAIEALVVRHLAELEDACRIMSKLDSEVWRLIVNKVSNWADTKGWDSERDKNDDICFAPKAWKLKGASDDDDFLASRAGYFTLDWGEDDGDWDDDPEHDLFDVTRLCQVTKRGKLGFRWMSDYFVTGNKVSWRGFIGEFAEQIKLKTGLTHENGTASFYIPFSIDVKVLAKAIEDDAIEDSLTPIDATLNSVATAESVLTDLLEKAKRKFRR